MSSPILKQLDVDNLVKRYAAGETIRAIADSIGVSHGTINNRLRAAGVELRRAGSARIELDLDEVIRLYVHEQLSASRIALQFGVSEKTICHRLRESGVEIRPGYMSGIRPGWPQEGPQARLGATDTSETKRRRAATKEATHGIRMGADEGRFAELLDAAGVRYVRQKAIDFYNLDFALEESRIAVEIERSSSLQPLALLRRPQRVEAILDAGWSLVEIFGCDGKSLIGAANNVVAYAQVRCLDPTMIGEHWMIRPDGQVRSRSRYELNRITSPFASKGA